MDRRYIGLSEELVSKIEGEGFEDAFGEEKIRDQLRSSSHQKARLSGMMADLKQKLRDVEEWLRPFPQDAYISDLLKRRAACEKKIDKLRDIINSY